MEFIVDLHTKESPPRSRSLLGCLYTGQAGQIVTFHLGRKKLCSRAPAKELCPHHEVLLLRVHSGHVEPPVLCMQWEQGSASTLGKTRCMENVKPMPVCEAAPPPTNCNVFIGLWAGRGPVLHGAAGSSSSPCTAIAAARASSPGSAQQLAAACTQWPQPLNAPKPVNSNKKTPQNRCSFVLYKDSLRLAPSSRLTCPLERQCVLCVQA